MTGPSRIGLDPALGALRLSGMMRRGELLPCPPEPTPAPCEACGCTCQEDRA